jgi:hypothetical protein
MKQLILPMVALLFCSMILPTDCSRFRNGKFKSKIDGAPYFIERNGDFQREYILGTADSATLTFHVKWISDCIYTVDPTEETHKKIPAMPKDAILTSEIIKTTDSTYTTKSTSNFSTLVDTVTFTRVN